MDNCGGERNTNSPFEEPWWLDIVAQKQWHEVVVKRQFDNKDKIVARLPYVMKSGKIRLPSYTQTLGIWISDEFRKVQRGNDHLGNQKTLIHELLKQLPDNKGIDITLDSIQQYILPFRWEGFSIEPFFSYRITNLSDLGKVTANYSKNIKRDINRGKKLLYIDDSSCNINEFIDLQNKTYKRQNRNNPIDNEFTKHVIKKTIELGHGKLLLAKDLDNKVHAGAFLLYDDRICYHLLSGQDTSFGNDGAMPFLLSNEIMFAHQMSNIFDFEGSMVEGIEQVYRRYGGNQVTLWRVTKQSIFADFYDKLKPRIKRYVGYKM